MKKSARSKHSITQGKLIYQPPITLSHNPLHHPYPPSSTLPHPPSSTLPLPPPSLSSSLHHSPYPPPSPPSSLSPNPPYPARSPLILHPPPSSSRPHPPPSALDAYLPAAGGQVLEGSGRTLQRVRVGALGQQGEVGLDDGRVPQHLHALGRVRGVGEWSHAVPLWR